MNATFHLLDMDRIIRAQGADRVSETASLRLSRLLENRGEEILFKARILARHAGRREIRKDDILLAASQVI